ncbi:MAG: lytic transglycosylase domain-containing protein, partial [Gammaproteobacteria bacterium]|nr:lytic transglycosylase domain-containing protein [Gammaproteobacteria bacterium]
ADYWDDLEIRFPLHHRSLIEAEAEKNAIESAWIFAILRQESMFIPGARSPVGALGLMQIMPPTAKDLAKRLKIKNPSEDELLKPELNIRLGSYYLRLLKSQFNGWELLAIPSYNAGPHRTQRWLPDEELEVDLWIEDIPFDETRLYVQRVLSYRVLYQYRMGQKVTRLKGYLPAKISKALLQSAPSATQVAAQSSGQVKASSEPAAKKGFLDH